MNKDIIDLAVNKKFTEFSDVIKGTLLNKLAGHSDIQEYTNEYDNIKNLKVQFNAINKPGDEDV